MTPWYSLNPLLSEAGFSTTPYIPWYKTAESCLNPLLSEAGFSTGPCPICGMLWPGGLNPLLSEAGFSTEELARRDRWAAEVLILF